MLYYDLFLHVFYQLFCVKSLQLLFYDVDDGIVCTLPSVHTALPT